MFGDSLLDPHAKSFSPRWTTLASFALQAWVSGW